MKREADLRRWLTRALRGKDILLQPIETGGMGLGVPDYYIATQMGSAWMELKMAYIDRRENVKFKWQPGQLNWLWNHSKLGRISLLMCVVEPEALFIMRGANILDSYKDIGMLISLSAFNAYIPTLSGRQLLEALDKIIRR